MLNLSSGQTFNADGCYSLIVVYHCTVNGCYWLIVSLLNNCTSGRGGLKKVIEGCGWGDGK